MTCPECGNYPDTAGHELGCLAGRLEHTGVHAAAALLCRESDEHGGPCQSCLREAWQVIKAALTASARPVRAVAVQEALFEVRERSVETAVELRDALGSVVDMVRVVEVGYGYGVFKADGAARLDSVGDWVTPEAGAEAVWSLNGALRRAKGVLL